MPKKKQAKAPEFARIPVKTVDEFLQDQEDGKLFGFYDIPEELYRPAPGHNWSTIKHRQKSANSYKFHLDYVDPKEKEHFVLGHLFHCLVLEPHTLDERYTTYPPTYPAKGRKVHDPPIDKPWNMNAGFCKEWDADMRAKGLIPVKISLMNQAKGMAKVLTDNPHVQHKLEDAAGVEIAAFWTDTVHGCLCKAKLDALRQTSEIIDLKSYRIRDAAQDPNEAALNTMYWEQHFCQAAMYRDGVDTILRLMRMLPKGESLLFTYFYTDKTPEKDTVILHIDCRKDQRCLSTDWYVSGQIVYRECLKLVLEGEKEGRWPSHNSDATGWTEPMEAFVPEFLQKRLETSTMS